MTHSGLVAGCGANDRCRGGISERFPHISPTVRDGARWLFPCGGRKYEYVTADIAVTQNRYFTPAFVILAQPSASWFLLEG